MNAYRAVFRLRLQMGLQYRTAALAGLVTQFFWGLMLIMLYDAFYSQATTQPDISFSQLVNYLWLQQAFLALVMLWFRDSELFNLITSGNIAYELCRPCRLYGFWFAKLAAQRLSAAAMRSIPILAVALVLPASYRLSLPANAAALALFLLALIMGFLVLVAISMLIYISVFYTMSPAGSLLLLAVSGEFFCRNGHSGSTYAGLAPNHHLCPALSSQHRFAVSDLQRSYTGPGGMDGDRDSGDLALDSAGWWRLVAAGSAAPRCHSRRVIPHASIL